MRRAGAKWAGTPRGAISASVADMELATPQVVVEAMLHEARAGGGYPGPDELLRPVEAAARWWRRHGLVLETDRCTPVGSVTAALAFALVRCSVPGDGVVRVRPTYPPLVDAIASTDRRDLPVDLVWAGDRWELDLDALEAACADASVLVWVAPHNPTGRVWDEAEVTAVAEAAARHQLLVLSDEIWADVLLHGARHVPFEPIARGVDPALAGRTATVVGTSKAWNLASAGAAVVHAEGEELWGRLHGRGHVPLLATPPRTALAGATAAWREGAAWLAATLSTIEANVDHAVTTWAEAFGRDRVTRPEGTYLVWVDLRGLVPADDPMPVLAVEDGVVPSDGAAFGGPGFVRVNLAVPRADATTIVARLAALVGAVADDGYRRPGHGERRT